eukprot:CAMPEP_0202924250 /NCGR_PEP_ID=MMETSP1392-20130828/78871_1 /ASSEMBLY_ACC=CAM_ASM_000868 /TAXON_ID=225041 /ORGANISM="Chlamydomonas chlamydogama, Strain SAG 11-48b" /LENGTH=172 /DNA_ID=CAMNT_0049617969 /DNA_START=288 /DNA_END=807 /DNA_ORIENTATION=-
MTLCSHDVVPPSFHTRGPRSSGPPAAAPSLTAAIACLTSSVVGKLPSVGEVKRRCPLCSHDVVPPSFHTRCPRSSGPPAAAPSLTAATACLTSSVSGRQAAISWGSEKAVSRFLATGLAEVSAAVGMGAIPAAACTAAGAAASVAVAEAVAVVVAVAVAEAVAVAVADAAAR